MTHSQIQLTPMNNFRIQILFALLVSLLTGCGPIYDTQYIFDPPESSGGRACVYQCENSRGQCQQLEEYRRDDCERDSEREKRYCEEDIWRRKHREPKWYECGGSSCSADTERCESQYRNCYQSCGGNVRAETRCVANCDQIPPQQQPQGQSNAPYYREDYRDGGKKTKR